MYGLHMQQPMPVGTQQRSAPNVPCQQASLLTHLCLCPQHLTSLLAAPAPAVVVAVLQTLQVLARRTHHVPTRWAPPAGLAHRLLCMSRGWGGKEEVRARVRLYRLLHSQSILQGRPCWSCV